MDKRPLRMLSGTEIVDRGKNVTNCILPEVGTKEVNPNGSWLEAKQIQTALEARKILVAVERIDKLGALSHAEWREQIQLAEVTQQVGGHWQYLGHKVNGKLFLLPEEALYLIETNCLLLKHNHVTVSLQKAYSLLLNNHITLMHYKVYASLSRVGYKVFRHDTSKLTAEVSKKSNELLKEKKIDKMDTDNSGNENISTIISLPHSDQNISNSESTISSDKLVQNIVISNEMNEITNSPDLPLPVNSAYNNITDNGSEKPTDTPLLPNGNIYNESAESSINTPLPTGNINSSDQPLLINPAHNNITDNGSEKPTDTPLLPNGNIYNESAETSINTPLPAGNINSSDHPLLINPAHNNITDNGSGISTG